MIPQSRFLPTPNSTISRSGLRRIVSSARVGPNQMSLPPQNTSTFFFVLTRAIIRPSDLIWLSDPPHHNRAGHKFHAKRLQTLGSYANIRCKIFYRRGLQPIVCTYERPVITGRNQASCKHAALRFPLDKELRLAHVINLMLKTSERVNAFADLFQNFSSASLLGLSLVHIEDYN